MDSGEKSKMWYCKRCKSKKRMYCGDPHQCVPLKFCVIKTHWILLMVGQINLFSLLMNLRFQLVWLQFPYT
jgi:hypothetical protein